MVVARILQMREQSPIISNHYASSVRAEPPSTQACPPLVTPQTFGDLGGRSRERGPRKIFLDFEVKNYDPAVL